MLLYQLLGKTCQFDLIAMKKAFRSSLPLFQQFAKNFLKDVLSSLFLYVNSRTVIFRPFSSSPALELNRRKPHSPHPFPRWREEREKLLQLLLEQKWLFMSETEAEVRSLCDCEVAVKWAVGWFERENDFPNLWFNSQNG